MNHTDQYNAEFFEHQLNTVFELHEHGNREDAEALYRELISNYPSIWQLHFNYGLLLFESDRFTEAAEIYHQGLKAAPDNPDLWYNLALCLKSLQSFTEAIAAYEKALSCSPGDPDILYNIAGCYRVMNEDHAAMGWYEKTLGVNPDHLSALNNLAYLYHKNDDSNRAAELYRRLLELAPDHERADHMLASIEGRSRDSAPDSYIRDVFDQFSDHYETSLIDKLEYRLPAVLLQFMKRSSGNSSFGRLLDLGCGTGLAGEVLSPHCTSMTGIDISQKMVDIARDKAIYSALHVTELHSFLSSSESGSYDCIVAADVLPYIGELKALFTRLAEVGDDVATIFFSVEALANEEKTFQLQSSGRFAHSPAYIEGLAQDTGWHIIACDKTNLRREKDSWITGLLFAFQRR